MKIKARQFIKLKLAKRDINYVQLSKLMNDKGYDENPNKISDTQKYKQLGNTVSIPVIEELAKYMYKCLEEFENYGI